MDDGRHRCCRVDTRGRLALDEVVRRRGGARSGRLVECVALLGRLLEVDVEGWDQTAYLHPDAMIPRRIDARALLSPFDPVVWYRDRAERLFGFHYRIEIYTPAPKRKFGYYVLPFLMDGEIVARVDLKTDRKAEVLRVQAAHLEPGHRADRVAPRLAAHLEDTARWLDCGAVEVVARGDLAGDLRARSS